MLLSLCNLNMLSSEPDLDCNKPEDFEAYLALLKTTGSTSGTVLNDYEHVTDDRYISKEDRKYLTQLIKCALKEVAEMDEVQRKEINHELKFVGY